MECLSRGDANGARHFGYYAELRGAMAILATEGVGIFDKQHFVVANPNTCVMVPKRNASKIGKTKNVPVGLATHRMVWLALEHWANLGRSGQLLLTIVRINQRPLIDWLDNFGASTIIEPLGIKWLRQWGVDLRELSNDRDARNLASYRPTEFWSSGGLDALTISRSLRAVWEMCRPSDHSRFDSLDRHLLRISLDWAFQASESKAPTRAPARFRNRVNSMLDQMDITGGIKTEWEEFLIRESEPEDPELLKRAGDAAGPEDPFHHINVAARATALLRLAAGACARLLVEAGIDKDLLGFWWKEVGNERGLWAPATPPNDLADLWIDAFDALNDLESWEARHATNPGVSLFELRQDQAPALATLGGCERVALWGLGL